MTKQEVHDCDVCGERFYVPEESLRKLTVDDGTGHEEIDYEVCSKCYDSLMKWILKRRGENPE